MSAVERIARRARERAVARAAEAIRAAVPGVTVEAGPEGVVVTGRRLRRDARLRWIAGLLR